jgi:hypothetical protein
LCINHDFCTKPLDVRCVRSNGLSTKAAPLLSLTHKRHSAARYAIASLALTRSIFGTVNARRRRASVQKCLAAFCD